MSETSADGAPHNGQSGRATWQSAPPAAVPPPPEGGRGPGAPDPGAGSTGSGIREALEPEARAPGVREPGAREPGVAEADGPAAPVSPAPDLRRRPSQVPGSRRRSGRATVLRLLALAFCIVLLLAGVALGGALVWPKTYAARAEVLYPITQEQPTGFLREDRSMTTQLVMLQGRPVLGPIAQQQGRTVEELQQHVTVTVLDSSEIIELQVTDRSAERALQTTRQILDRYLGLGQSSQPTLRQRLETELVAGDMALRAIQTRLTTQQGAVASGTAAGDTVAPLQSALQAQQVRQQQLQAQLDSINLAPVPQLLTPPYAVGVVSPRPVFVTVTGALLGVVLAGGVVAVVARNRTRQRELQRERQ